VKGVFEISGTSRYDDFITERYHFPKDYLKAAEALVGDWVVYRETRAARGRMAYIATAFVNRIDPDPVDPTHFYARVQDFLQFDKPVPYRNAEGRFAEQFLREMTRPADAGRTLRGTSVRRLEDEDFANIIDLGLLETLAPENRVRLGLDPTYVDAGTQSLLDAPIGARRVVSLLMNRKVRDASFRNNILAAYDSTCAITGIKIISGGGRAEAQAAHIWPVAEGGPDITQNGLALSATTHWLFDRHLISLDNDMHLLVSPNKLPSQILGLFPPIGMPIRLPPNKSDHPRPDFLARHRDRFTSHNFG
jgi:putative restriction endonuclease